MRRMKGALKFAKRAVRQTKSPIGKMDKKEIIQTHQQDNNKHPIN